MFGFKKREPREPIANYIIKPKSDGGWYIEKAWLSLYGIAYYPYEPVSYSTLEEAKKAVDNLQRPWVKIP